MATTKYIVNNLNQSINANMSVIGLSVSNINGIGNYKALLTQTGTITGNNYDFGNKLIKGETYTITDYSEGDDFSNIANWQEPGTINATGSVFTSTGSFPKIWSNGSVLTSNGDLIVDVIENNLGYNIDWAYDTGPFGPGTYIGVNDKFGPIINSFPQDKTLIKVGNTQINNPYIINTRIFAVVGSFDVKDEFLLIGVYDTDSGNPIGDTLMYLPVEINIKQDLDTTPVIISGTISSAFPFGYAAFDLYINENNNYDSFYTNDNTIANNATELAYLLNNNSNTNIFGTFSAVGENGITLTIPQNLKNQLSPDGDLTFDVYSD